MWRNYLAAALHNLFRNRAYAAINILGLALGFYRRRSWWACTCATN